MKEGDFQKWFIKTLKLCGALTFNVHGHGMQAVGWPDVYVAHRMYHGWVELKAGSGGRLSQFQKDRIHMLLDHGVPAVVLAWRPGDGGDVQVEDTTGKPYLDERCVQDWNTLQRSCKETPVQLIQMLVVGAFQELEYRGRFNVYKMGFPPCLLVDGSGELG